MNFELKYIDHQDELYDQAKKIRIDCFFSGMTNAEELINDAYERIGNHLVLINNKGQVIGTGRFHTMNSIGIISQMAVRKENQKTGIGAILLNELIKKSKAIGMNQIELSARETAISFYKKKGFKTLGDKYPSIKTGIIHQKMILITEDLT
ncbi:GNAT family N-acetyltransferase [Flammeovirga pacifica]|uniref:N-acetyltransferase domain-containing protein n=1 Tax=Flammeovirga pacifica TaxID=915059 RepID=A0A1S1YWN2_FLAPC|nr:GNAT family N-acetyltransferase [Flammeovirga pacifica]OHX65437.1 hypothetical protein NH26_03280 [Flammeovirga pacifica]